MKTDPASSKANSKSQEHHPKENDVIDLTVPNKHTSKKGLPPIMAAKTWLICVVPLTM